MFTIRTRGERGLAAALLGAALLSAGCEGKPSTACGNACAPAAKSSAAKSPAAKWKELVLVAGHPGGQGWVDGPGDAAHFLGPFGLAFDGTDHLYLTDDTLIREYQLSTNTVRTIAGGLLGGGADGTGASASFHYPTAVVVGDGVLYVADTENNTLRTVEWATGKVTTLVGAAGAFGQDEGIGTAARVAEPEGLAWDREQGQLYFSDTDNNTIRKVDLESGMTTTVAGMVAVSGMDDGVGAAARFAKPMALVLDTAGRVLYIADSVNHALRKLTLDDARVSTLAILPVSASSLALSLDGSEVFATTGIVVSGVSTDTGAIRVVAGDAAKPGFVDGQGTAARFGTLYGLVADGQGSLFVADPGSGAVRKLELESGVVTTLLGSSSVGAIDDIGDKARFSKPQGVVAVSDTLLYVADTENHAIRSVELTSGKVTTVAGVMGEAGHADGSSSAARFDRPSGLALDGTKVLYIAELGNQDLRRLELSSGVVSTLAVSSEPASAAVKLVAPGGLAFERGRLYVTESARILAVDIDSGKISVLAQDAGTSSLFAALGGVVVDGHGNLLVADVLKNSILQVAIDTGKVSTFVGPLGFGTDRLYSPRQLVLRPDGTLFVADAYTIRQVGMDGGTLTTVVGALDGHGVKTGPLPAQLGESTALASIANGRLAIVAESSILVVK